MFLLRGQSEKEIPTQIHFKGKDYYDLVLLQRGWTAYYNCVKKLACACHAKITVNRGIHTNPQKSTHRRVSVSRNGNCECKRGNGNPLAIKRNRYHFF